MKKALIVVIGVLFLLLTLVAFAQAEEEGVTGSFSVGGGESSSENFAVEGVLGAPAVGEASSENFSISSGSSLLDVVVSSPATGVNEAWFTGLALMTILAGAAALTLGRRLSV